MRSLHVRFTSACMGLQCTGSAFARRSFAAVHRQTFAQANLVSTLTSAFRGMASKPVASEKWCALLKSIWGHSFTGNHVDNGLSFTRRHTLFLIAIKALTCELHTVDRVQVTRDDPSLNFNEVFMHRGAL